MLKGSSAKDIRFDELLCDGFINMITTGVWRTSSTHDEHLEVFLDVSVSRWLGLDHPSYASVENETWRDLAPLEQQNNSCTWFQLSGHLVGVAPFGASQPCLCGMHDSETYYRSTSIINLLCARTKAVWDPTVGYRKGLSRPKLRAGFK